MNEIASYQPGTREYYENRVLSIDTEKWARRRVLIESLEGKTGSSPSTVSVLENVKSRAYLAIIWAPESDVSIQLLSLPILQFLRELKALIWVYGEDIPRHSVEYAQNFVDRWIRHWTKRVWLKGRLNWTHEEFLQYNIMWQFCLLAQMAQSEWRNRELSIQKLCEWIPTSPEAQPNWHAFETLIREIQKS